MTKVNLNIELSIDDERLKENGLTVDEIMKQLYTYDNNDIDGYIITRDTSDNDNNFYINDAQIKEVYTQEKQLQRLEDMLGENLGILSDELKENDFEYSSLNLYLISTIVEINSMIYATIEMTGITEKLINKNLLSDFDLTFSMLTDIENTMIDRM